MWIPLLALVIGFVAVYLPRVEIPVEYAEYIGLAVVAGFDSVIGAARSYMEGTFNDRIFVTGFFSNAAIAAMLLYCGNALSIKYVAVAIMVALFIRIFNNLGYVRRYASARLFEKKLTAENTFPEP